MAPLGLLLNVVIVRQAAPGPAGGLAGILGVLFGSALDRTTRIEVADGRLIARRLAPYFVLWGISYAITQILVSVPGPLGVRWSDVDVLRHGHRHRHERGPAGAIRTGAPPGHPALVGLNCDNTETTLFLRWQ